MNAPNEFPWTYYLMIVAHIVILSTAAGRTLGLDGLQAGYGLSAAAAASILFIFAPSNDAVRLIRIGAVAAVILLILATVAWLAGLGIGFSALWYASHSARRSD